MRLVKTAVLSAAVGILLIPGASLPLAAERGGFRCRGAERITVQDLDVSPDPLIEGQRIKSWRVRVRFDGNRECETEIMIREGDDIVAQGRRTTLRPGDNEIELQPAGNYRFRGREHCFDVLVDAEGSRRRIDADRRFCARQRPSWSLREPGDRPQR